MLISGLLRWLRLPEQVIDGVGFSNLLQHMFSYRLLVLGFLLLPLGLDEVIVLDHDS